MGPGFRRDDTELLDIVSLIRPTNSANVSQRIAIGAGRAGAITGSMKHEVKWIIFPAVGLVILLSSIILLLGR
jgi:hypothetical protein